MSTEIKQKLNNDMTLEESKGTGDEVNQTVVISDFEIDKWLDEQGKQRSSLNCGIYTSLSRRKKLDKATATSIICSTDFLDNSDRLQRVADNGSNIYYRVNETNTVIMHVEEDFCIVTSYMVDTYKNERVNLAKVLSLAHYGVYQDSSCRDYIKNTVTGEKIGYDILNIVYGDGVRISGMSQEHCAETFNETIENIKFDDNNINRGSHRVRIEIKNEADLNFLIDRIKENDRKKGWLFPELVRSKKTLER